jgi:molybdopterin-containing oxidoreductase family iron-sulfur binding subunit
MTMLSAIRKLWKKAAPAPAPEAAVAPQTPKASCKDCSCSASLGDKPLSRRRALGAMATASAASVAVASKAVDPKVSKEEFETTKLAWEEYFKGNFRVMTQEERRATVERLERLSQLRGQGSPHISDQGPRENVLYGYAFNISKCQGYMDCVKACVEENNLDRDTAMQYIRVFELKNGNMQLESANGRIAHTVPVEGHFYFATQCFHCENPPCVDVCPVGATWKEKDGIVVVDYDWCVGCRYCEAACPYWGRRFNWKTPNVEPAALNLEQHYLGNRPRAKGVMEKCTFCIQRSREGRQPACVEACPTGARIFGNLLDPNSEIRWVLANKKVFRLKEDLGTEPKFWYFMD